MIIRHLFRTFFSENPNGKPVSPAQPDPLALAYSEIAELRGTVFDLLVEIEAIRETLLNSPLGSGGSRSAYAKAYLKAACTTHNSTGPSGGHEKLMERFYSDPRERDDWRECLFMLRLGFSPVEIAKYKEEAEAAHYYT